MSKRKKLNLNELSVKSFVTSDDSKILNTVKGGIVGNLPGRLPIAWLTEGANYICQYTLDNRRICQDNPNF